MHNNKSQLKTDGQEIITPTQVVIKNTPVGSRILLLNWPEFWPAFSLDQNRADLFWNERTKQDRRGALQAEVQKLDVEKERTEDIIPGPIERSLCRPILSMLATREWNQCEGIKVLLRDPFAFFQALYHRFLCDANTGLTIDGAVPDEMGGSDDWCDMGILDGFGGGGGFLNDFDYEKRDWMTVVPTDWPARSRLVLRRNTHTWENVTGWIDQHQIGPLCVQGLREDIPLDRKSMAFARECTELPSSDSVGAIVFESGPNTATDYNVIIEEHSGFTQRVHKFHPCYMSLQFPLLFIYGQEGYHLGLKLLDVPGISSGKQKKMSINMYYAYQLHEHQKQYTLLTRGNLKRPKFGTFIEAFMRSRMCRDEDVDMYISAELLDQWLDPKGYRVVSELMMHGLCGLANRTTVYAKQ
ncbi:hypothetical protein Tco_1360885 [Tanacetum coccineum]